jgi:ATP-binding cassette, subfamily F, member 3
LPNTSIRNVLAAFSFTNDDVFKRIKDLSGGERGRVSLAKLMLSEANLLVLDEPTNHLDITSKEILENAINNYTGTVLYISHDRYFINKTATRILDLTQQQLINYIGNYDYYLEKKPVNEVTISENATLDSEGKLDWKQQKEEQARIRKQQNELEKCEKEIHTLEVRNMEIDTLLTQQDVFTNVSRLMELNNEKKELEIHLEELLNLWESLAL